MDFIMQHKAAIVKVLIVLLIAGLSFFAGWKACQHFGANIVEKPVTVTEVSRCGDEDGGAVRPEGIGARR